MFEYGLSRAAAFGRRLRMAAHRLGPRAADLGSGLATTADVEFIVGLTCGTPTRAPLVRGELFRLPFLSGAFTGVLAPPDVDRAELARILQPGGTAIVDSADPLVASEFVAAGLDMSGAENGFVVVRKRGVESFEIEKPSLFSMFVPRRWLERRPR